VPRQLGFVNHFDFSQFPHDWSVFNASVDWEGNPLLLVQEGKPRYPGNDTSIDTQAEWLNTPPKANHLIYWEGNSRQTLTFDKSARPFAFHVQRFGDGWLLDGDICDRTGRVLKRIEFGGGSNDVQTTSDGHIWVSYGDEAVFGHGIGQNGVVCFNSQGQPIFKYLEFAERNQLPFIDDCYAMNVVSEEEAWLCYYGDFPLVSIKNFQLYRCWKDFGCIDRAFALRGETIIFPKCYTQLSGKSQLLVRTLSGSGQAELVDLVDEDGTNIEGHFTSVSRGAHFYLTTETALYKLPIETLNRKSPISAP
jgi:hypothetical protein